ncbi:hypothetical protein QZM93_38540 [Burkholderia cepacia]|uniref:hypothetical protein n=1 Tax=Burkholderia cepacia complex TaxID=87882 RepID=UPI00158B9771|nr:MULTISPECIES: hypothetical protein [Burkholderia cepacia complex]MBR8409805.1 hypothetical protein [Burkholderia cenocepacia]MCA8026435.1 hypothetical protein [Burkholderia cepacia]MDN7894502.1 hypothetical protein [Burkholderia cepacia]
MSEDRVEQPVALPLAAAADLATRAAKHGVAVPDYLGMHVLRSAYGPFHPASIQLEKWAVVGQAGTEEGNRD